MTRVVAVGLTLFLAACTTMTEPDPGDWDAVVAQARGQTVYWYAWAGDRRVNNYIAWVARETERQFEVGIEHVKIADTAEAVSRVLGEKSAGRAAGGSVDLIWINGENFAAMKEHGLLFGPWVEQMPNWRYVDVEGKPAVTRDFTVPTEGLEAPWSMAQVVFYYDTARVADPPRSMKALLDWARAHPGRFTYPQPPDFVGTTFLKQALYGLLDDVSMLQDPVSEATYTKVTAPLWSWLDTLTPHLWRSSRAYPQSGPRMRQMMADGEIDIAISFSPGEASAAIANQELPETVRTYVLDGGTIGNASFVAIPYNAAHKAGAMVVANFLMSPEAQARKQDPKVWGSLTVLDIERLPAADRARFANLDLGVATLSREELGQALQEPHPSWMVRIEEDWLRRYGVVP
ncbi:MAG: ABC transporter substrate-binding protein [Luteitalea sp.]|nr:ABC transporter substrate-binding protein [Luteitalea sp.]